MNEILYYLLFAFNAFFFMIVLYNLFTAPRVKLVRAERYASTLVSVLIPARNEEKNIEACLKSVCNQSHNNLEIFVLDDDSTDRTAELVTNITQRDKRVKLVKGNPLPEGWLGKNWACHQLSAYPKGKIFLFIDADVEMTNNAIASAVDLFYKKAVKLLSVFPSQKINSIGASLITPLMNWLLLTFLPLQFVYTFFNKSFVAANGQFMMFDRHAYDNFGGHILVKDKVVEDMEIARVYKEGYAKMMTALGGSLIFCKMYSSFGESFEGFSKNFFPGFKLSEFSFFSFLILILAVFLLPFYFFFDSEQYLNIVLLALLSRLMISVMSRQSIFINLLLHPIQMALIPVVGINSIFINISKRATWKDRKLF